jgi:hypothetical protein
MQVELNKTYFYKENGNSVTTIGYLNDNKIQLSDGSIIKSDRFFNYFTDRVSEQSVNSYNNTFQTNVTPQYTQTEQVPSYIVNPPQHTPIHNPTPIHTPIHNPQQNSYPQNNYPIHNPQQGIINIKNDRNYNPDYGGVIKEQRISNNGQQITFVELEPTIEFEVRDNNGNIVMAPKKSMPPVNNVVNTISNINNFNSIDGYDFSVMDEEEKASLQEYYNRNNKPVNNPTPNPIQTQPINTPTNMNTTFNKPNYVPNITSQAKDLLSKMKKSHEANFSFVIKTKVPDLEYLKKSEEMLNIDLFDALSEELVEYYINNPQTLKRTIANELKNLNTKNLVKVKDTPKKTNKKKEKLDIIAPDLDEYINAEEVDAIAVNSITITE